KDNFELCYKLQGTADRYIVPSLLSPQKPDYQWDENDNLQFRFQYPFMPKGLVSRLIVRMHNYVDQNKLWKEGVVIDKEGVKVQLIEEKTIKEGLKIVAIRLIGEASKRKDLLTVIREEIKKIQASSFPNLPFVEMVPCCCQECAVNQTPYFFDYSDIENYLKKGKVTIDCRKSTEIIPINTLVGSVFNADEIQSKVESLTDDNKNHFHINLSHIGNPQVNVSQEAILTATQTQTVVVTIENVMDVQGLFANLKEDIFDEIDIEIDDEKERRRVKNDLQKAQKAFDALEKAAGNKSKTLDNASRHRLKEFVSNIGDEDSRLNRALEFVDRGKDKLQALGRAYNKIAPNFTLPSIPPILLGSEYGSDYD
ncbi:MAG: hypothetical protein ACI9FJ_000794, partial [Alteromonadaceae bacterium]